MQEGQNLRQSILSSGISLQDPGKEEEENKTNVHSTFIERLEARQNDQRQMFNVSSLVDLIHFFTN